MLEPVTISAVAFAIARFVAEHATGHIIGGEAHHFYRQFLERWRESPVDPKTGLPHNHDLESAGAESLRGTLFVLVLELAGRIEPKKSWLNNLAERIPGGGFLDKDIFPGTQAPQRRWLDGLRRIVASDKVKILHRTLKLEEGDLRQRFVEGDVCKALEPGLADSILVWARFELAGQAEPADFESLVRSTIEIVAVAWDTASGTNAIFEENGQALGWSNPFDYVTGTNSGDPNGIVYFTSAGMSHFGVAPAPGPGPAPIFKFGLRNCAVKLQENN